jgi:hypothetical protein
LERSKDRDSTNFDGTWNLLPAEPQSKGFELSKVSHNGEIQPKVPIDFQYFSLSPEFRPNKSIEVQCRTSTSRQLKSFSFEFSSVSAKIYCFNQLGHLIIFDQNSISFEILHPLLVGQLQTIFLEPKITRTDESLRSLDPVR